MGSGGWLHKGKVLSHFMFVVLYENLLTFICFLRYNLLIFRRKKSGDWKKRKRHIIYIFYWFGRTRSFAYVPVRDQNLVVRGRHFVWFVLYFLLVLKIVSNKKPIGKWELICILILKEKGLKVEIKLIEFD